MSNTELARPEDLDLVNLDHVIANYNCETDRTLIAELSTLEDRLWTQIYHHDAQSPYEIPLADHLLHNSLQTEGFLRYLGCETKAAENYRRAMLFSKLGYIQARNFDKSFGPLRHGMLNRQAAREMAENGCKRLATTLSDMSQEFRMHPHIRVVMPALMHFQYECVNGRGPYGRDSAETGLIIRVAAIVNAFAEQRHTSQPEEQIPQAVMKATEAMCSDDQAHSEIAMNNFDRGLLEAYASFRLKQQNKKRFIKLAS